VFPASIAAGDQLYSARAVYGWVADVDCFAWYEIVSRTDGVNDGPAFADGMMDLGRVCISDLLRREAWRIDEFASCPSVAATG
jgi:hypothetical protein